MTGLSIYCKKHKTQKLGSLIVYPQFAKANKISRRTGLYYCPKCKKAYRVRMVIEN